ncbi:MAG: hypothetical protein JWP29_473 [Rhodoferax sp.]|nr:hypothetical protein [Rhodoferax sp.]
MPIAPAALPCHPAPPLGSALRLSRVARMAVFLCLMLCCCWVRAATYTVTTTADTGGTCTAVVAGAATCTTLREAINAADATVGTPDTILFSSAMANGTIILSSVLPNVSDTLTIDGQSNNITVSANGATISELLINGTTGSQLLNMTLTKSGGALVIITGATNARLQGNTFCRGASSGSTTQAVMCSGCTNFTFTQNTITDWSRSALVLSNMSAATGNSATVTNNVFNANSIGVDMQGASNALVDQNTMTGNRSGVRLFRGDSNVITNNSISGGDIAGIEVGSSTATGSFSNNLIQGNTITSNSYGIQFKSSSSLQVNQNTMTGNTISGHGIAGIAILTPNSTGNAMYNNSIFGNGGLGIDLGPAGVSLNDAGDTDTGFNDLQNFPVFKSIVGNQVMFTLDTTANGNGYRIDFYNNPGGVDPSGYGEGQTFLGFCVVASPSATVPSTCTVAGASVTTLRATATRCQAAGCSGPTATLSIGSTSEFNKGLVPPTVKVAKNSVGAVGSFGFDLTNVSTLTDSVVTTTSGTTVTSATVHTGTAGVLATVTETVASAAGYTTAVSCVDANSAITGNTVAVAKNSVGGVGPFAFNLTGVTNATDNVTTATSGTSVVSATTHIGTVGTAATVVETAVAGYSTATSCVDANGAASGNGAAAVTSATGTASLTAGQMSTAAVWTCTFTNTLLPTVKVAKNSVGGVGTFAFNLTGVTIPADNVTTVTAGSTVVSATTHTGTVGTAATVVETAVPGYSTATSCVDANGAANGNGAVAVTSATGAASLTASQMRGGAAWTCTFANTRLVADLSIVKTANPTTVQSGGTVTFTLTVNNAGPAAANGAVVRDNPGAGLSCVTAPTCTASGGAVCPAAAALTVAAMAGGGGVAIPTLPNGGGTVFTLTCTVTATGQ